jgi:hypothetical protein
VQTTLAGNQPRRRPLHKKAADETRTRRGGKRQTETP